MTQATFASYPFFHKELLDFDPTKLGYYFHSLPQLSDLRSHLLIEDPVEREEEMADCEGRMVADEFVGNGLWSIRTMQHWESLFKFRVRYLLDDYKTFQRVVTESGVAWNEDYAKFLKLGILLITKKYDELLKKDTAVADGDSKPKYEEYVVMSPSYATSSDACTQIGLGMSRPKTEPASLHNNLDGSSAVGQILFSDLDQFLTPIGVLPRKGLLSIYYGYGSCSTFYDPSVTMETDCHIIAASREAIPGLLVEGFVETLHLDSTKPFEGLTFQKFNEICDKFSKERRVGDIPIEQFHMIGGQTVDFQGNYECKDDEFLVLQTDVDVGAMIQMFFIAKKVELQAANFSNVQAGNSLSR